jgi:hypothetical protein
MSELTEKNEAQICALCKRETDMAVRHPEGMLVCTACARMAGKAVERMDDNNNGPHILATTALRDAVSFANRAMAVAPDEKVH